MRKLVTVLENLTLPASQWLLSFFAIIFVRHYLECFSQTQNYLNLASSQLNPMILHFTLSYCVLALALLLLLHYATCVPILKITQVIIPACIILWLNPLLDLIFSFKTGVSLAYLQPDFKDLNVIKTYLTFFGYFSGASLGLRIEIACALFGIYGYLQIKAVPFWARLVYVWLAYTLIFIWGATPILVASLLTSLGFIYHYSAPLLTTTFLLWLFPLLFAFISKAWPHSTRTILQDARLTRLLHYELLVLLGVLVGINSNDYALWPQLFFKPEIISHFLLISISLFFACLFAINTNNQADVALDAISNPDRPLIQNTIALPQYQAISWLFLSMALLYAMAVDAATLLTMLFILSTYYVYSMLPLRLKRVFLLSKCVIGVNSVALALLGYRLARGDVFYFPWQLGVILLVGFSLCANVIDIKDTEADGKLGIKTLPTVLGVKRAQYVIATCFVITYLSFYFLVPDWRLLPIMFTGAGLQFYFITRRRYHEKPVFILENVSLMLLIGYLLLNKLA